jgi:hypothetical protein
MYDYNDDDFVFASVQAKDDFAATCSRLENAWKEMCSRYSSLHRVRKPLIFKATQKVIIQGSLVGGLPASGDIYIGSDSEHVEPPRRFHIQQRGPVKRKAK